MNIKSKLIYEKLWSNSIATITSQGNEIDESYLAHNDQWKGLSLIVKPSKQVTAMLGQLTNELKIIDRSQFYYKNNELHVTVMAIVTCEPGFTLFDSDIDGYIQAIKSSLVGISPFKLFFNGTTMSTKCVMAQGFQYCNELTKLRNNLRVNIRNSHLYHTMDNRYLTETSHCTISRFHDNIENRQRLIKKVNSVRQDWFGDTDVTELELMYGDWALTSEYTKSICKFKLVG